MSTVAPQDGMLYPVVIGGTVTGEEKEFFPQMLQYSFKPHSIDTSKDGLLRKTERGGLRQGEAHLDVEFANKNENGKVCFKGKYTSCKELECILIFDSQNNTFRLERLIGQGLSLKPVRNEKGKPLPTLQDDTSEVHTPPGRIRSNSAKTKETPHFLLPSTTTPTLPAPAVTSSTPPEDGPESAPPPKRKKRTVPKAPGTGPKRTKKSTPAVHKEVAEESHSNTYDSTADLFSDLANEIESGLADKSEPPSSNSNESNELHEDFSLAEELESSLASDSSVSLPPPHSFSSSRPALYSSTPPAPRPSLPAPPRPASAPPFPPSTTPLARVSSHPLSQPSLLPFASTTAGLPGQNGLPLNGGAKNPNESGSSESESESSSESESESESASSSASESENE